ncbi:putative tRNA-splicing endonuclease subunit sen-15 protein [Neofusicoccum parvum]|uniref:tRNA-splicing endonuclease subunit sen-15 protein n=2 Tax=Neofusicoccum parvum TaxID=310453 RepID=A0ACB5S5G0_9PEZI|nr:putative trna-splicing endonuclease subunit sen-15 protein [Neofusicoccum parvum UCRNP2]GME28039.1 putative tRNA-splicing endonuclease subunit sen-15 protein [Neofusicoccum parvum]GME54057.1 putative tRNA-splicing endonuclease subunit sen-15 protein [Neofusicoccum parvum]
MSAAHDDSPALSALATHIQTALPRRPPPAPQTVAHHALALQVQHNLQHQHQWTSLQLHTHSPLPPHAPLPRPLVSGLPPRRLYVHPDEQIELLKEEARRKKKGEQPEDPSPEREWVLPSHLREKWSLRRMGEVFDAIGEVPPLPEDVRVEDKVNRWRTTKRVMLGILEDDSTVVYYLVHDGLVKPRQN